MVSSIVKKDETRKHESRTVTANPKSEQTPKSTTYKSYDIVMLLCKDLSESNVTDESLLPQD